MTPLKAPPAREVARRSKNATRLGVLFVHGVGQSAHSDTLIDFGNTFAGWVARWQRAHKHEPAYGEVELSFTPYDAGSDNTVPYANFATPNGKTWVCTEAWWAGSARPLPFTDMLVWSARHLVSLIAHLVQSITRRLDRLVNKSPYDAGHLYLIVDVVTCLGLLLLYPLLGLVGYLLLFPIFILAQIPYPPFQQFVLVAFLQPLLQYNASELRVYIEDDIQAANMRRRVADAIDWLTDEQGGNCELVTIVAHSGGAWVAHGMLTDDTYADQRECVRKLITIGSGLNKIWELAPSTLDRVRKPITGNIFWVDFWSSYDPVPAGWLEPPRDGAHWYPIYAPRDEFAIEHGLERRTNPMPPDQQPGWKPSRQDALVTRPRADRIRIHPLASRGSDVGHPPEVQVDREAQPDPYWPDSIRVVNYMDALTDHGGYFTNDEEVLRRVAAEIDSPLYQQSFFWTGEDGQVKDAIPRRRSRLTFLALARVLGVLGGAVAAYFLGATVAEYIAGIGPIASALSGAREVLRLLENLPQVGPGAAWLWIRFVAFLLWLAGAAIASLIGLVPFRIVRAVWENNDLKERNLLLRENAIPSG